MPDMLSPPMGPASDARPRSVARRSPAPPTGGPKLSSRRQQLLDTVALGIGLLAVWEMLARTGVFPEDYIPPISVIVPQIVSLLGQPPFWSAVGHTIAIWVISLLIAGLGGTVAGLAIGSVAWLDRATSFVIEFLRPVPPVALIPLVVLVSGTGYESAVFLAAFAAFWPQLVQAVYGARAQDRVAVDTARAFRLTAVRRFTMLTLPAAAPYLATGTKISSSIALILTITAGIVIGSPGLGYEISLAATAGAYIEMYALIFVTGVLGYLLTLVMVRLERRVLTWQPEHREVRR